MSANPFDAPFSRSVFASTPGRYELASRGARLGGILVDALLQAIAMGIPASIGAVVGLALGVPLVDGDGELSMGGMLMALFATTGFLLLTAVQWYLVTTRGQSVGKIVVGTRIVRQDGSPCGFIWGVLVRSIAFGVLTSVVSMLTCGLGGWILPLANALCVFREDRRTLHDMLAGTVVVVAR